MHAIEFVASVEDGIIKVPKQYQNQLQEKFRVIILQDTPTEKTPSKRKKSLTAVQIATKNIHFNRDEANER